MTKYDLAIIGGGAAGMMAAISVHQHHPQAKIILLEKNIILGRKILATGNGRCNLTNVNLGAKHFNNSKFVETVLKQFGYKEIMKFFSDLGLLTYEEKKGNTGKIFPMSDAASSVVDLLTDAVRQSGAEIKLETTCDDIIKTKDGFLIKLKNNPDILVEKVILTTGGKTYPALGADGSSFVLAEKLGHKIVPTIPSGVPLEGKNILAQELQGLKMPAEIYLSDKEKFSGDLMFTKYGLSGTVTLLASRPLSVQLNRAGDKETKIIINFLPGYNFEQAEKFWLERKQKYPEREIGLDWSGVFSPKFAGVFLKLAGVSGKYSKINETTIKKIAKLLTEYEWKITATRGWNEAEFTAGGVDCFEVKSDTLESKKIAGLYLAGESLDVDGDIGGYNLSWAWSSGFVAGKLN